MKENVRDILYTVDERPPLSIAIFLGFQHYISMFIATLTIPKLLARALCMGDDLVGQTHITGTIFVASGVITIVQNLFGVRLPIVQAGTFALLLPTLSFFELESNSCLSSRNWKERLCTIQGSLMVVAVLELLLGGLGMSGKIMRFIGPLTIGPTISLLGFSLFSKSAEYASGCWPICIFTVLLIIVFSQYLRNIQIPIIMYQRQKGFYFMKMPIFSMFPIVFAIIIMWTISIILTVTNVFPTNAGEKYFNARTDLKMDAIKYSPWFRFPYPFQWGYPTIDIVCVLGLLSGILATIIESIGDYHTCADVCGATIPPLHAINRGIFVEGLGSMFDAMLGTGNGTTSTSINVGLIGLTKVGSRMVILISACFMIGLGIFTKFGAIFITIPDPIIAGAFIVLFAVIISVGMSQFYKMENNSRNLFIIGITLFVGISIPEYIKRNQKNLSFGNSTISDSIKILLSTHMFVGGVLGFLLDNTIPGTKQERGITNLNEERLKLSESKELSSIYNLPIGMNFIRKVNFFKYIPICPTYKMKYDEIILNDTNTTETNVELTDNSEQKMLKNVDTVKDVKFIIKI